jgi:hypothetical protein
VVRDPYAVIGSNGVLQAFHRFVMELEDVSAFDTHDVVVVLFFVRGFESGGAIAELAFVRETTVDQQLQRSVHRGLPDVRMAQADAPVQLVDVWMSFESEKGLGDCVALFGLSQAGFTQVRAELLFPGLG